jgi:mannose-6-phosphate isomerase-like protein (cupin superfamily)
MDRKEKISVRRGDSKWVDANEAKSLWVIGHRVTLICVGGRVAAIEVITPAGVPGPPPHHHEDADECFYVTAGRLGVMCGDSWTSHGPGEYMNVPRGTVHSFRNDGPDDVRVITGFEPPGFERFFLEYGVDVDEAGAVEASVSEATIARVIEGCAQFGMILAPSDQLPGVAAAAKENAAERSREGRDLSSDLTKEA